MASDAHYIIPSVFENFHSKKEKKTIFMQFCLLLGKIFTPKIVIKILYSIGKLLHNHFREGINASYFNLSMFFYFQKLIFKL